ncbi:hypothetical protein AB0I49_37830 [Streptomyces sp. NPDC050617]|uniref:hypothetical protein n=1 Tax=Streptomyces sp. NPDC050617 TaxID=3154628 RepID=UPI0034137209
MGEADETDLLGLLRRWRPRARLYAAPLAEETRAAVEAGRVSGRAASAAVREAVALREAGES